MVLDEGSHTEVRTVVRTDGSRGFVPMVREPLRTFVHEPRGPSSTNPENFRRRTPRTFVAAP
jgi:hypothetical protein